jgi:ABC-2 type transport system ATP-binding protein
MSAGEIVGLLGPNGAGKTTTLKLLLGLLRPSIGKATVLGFDCTRDSHEVKARAGFTHEEPQFYDFLTGRETLDFVINVRGLDPEAAWHSLQGAIAALEFEAQLGALTATYSHGTKKKLALLCAFVHRPAVLLLDEPANGLDPTTALRVREMLQDRARAGACVLVSTHLLDPAEALCHRLVVMHRGRKIADGTPLEIRRQASAPANANLEQAFVRLVAP